MALTPELIILCDYDMKGKLTHGKVAESRFDKRSYDSKPPPKNLPLPQNGLPQSVGKGSLLCFLKAKGWASSLSVGKPAAIQYGNGSVAGFFNEDSVTIGDLVVKDQKFIGVTKEPSHILSWLQNLVTILVSDFRK
uniref:Uncharacterized protein n=1 Tax=Oryza rufipogon TaxID=4529 RepID=A0A0E0P663_ORYRU